MADTIKIFCKNDGNFYEFPPRTALAEVSRRICPEVKDAKTGRDCPVLAALVNHKLKELGYEIVYPCEIFFIGFNHPDGRRSYSRSLCFVLQNAVRELYPDKVLVIDHGLPSGLYCELVERRLQDNGKTIVSYLTDEEVEKIEAKMKEIIDRDLPITKKKLLTEDARMLFIKNGQYFKSELQKSLGRYFCNVYFLDGHADSFHGPLVPSTGYLKVFGLMPFGEGFCIRYPSEADFTKLIPFRRQSKLAASLKEYSEWCQVTGILGIGDLNKRILAGDAVKIINLSEALQERKYAAIADMIYARRSEVKIVFIAGPSSSGKTSSSLRVAQQCRVLGLRPKVVELDNYFVERDQTPRDADGKFDFECLEAMDLDLLNRHLNDLLAGKAVEIPKYDFKAGMKRYEGNMLQLEDKDILIMEGIHALDPAMVASVDQSRIFRVYASALTSLNVDENNCISTSDNRLMRRIVRDNRYRGITPEKTLIQWESVRRGENKYIFPFQENADVLFNSALIYELPLLKYYVEPLLRRIPPSSPAYTEAVRLIKFLEYIVALQPSEIEAVPPTSIMREFIGGQTL